MNLLAPQHLIPILIILLLLFGRGKISELMGDFAKGIKSFKKGLKDDDEEEEVEEEAPVVKKAAVKTIEAQPDEAVAAGPSKRKSTEKTSARRTAKRKA